MAKVFIEESSLTAIGEAIRNKTGKTELLSPAAMPTEIEAIQTGGGEIEPVVLTGNCQYMCGSAWTQFFPYVSTTNITGGYNMFGSNNTVERIPFTINLGSNVDDFGYMFYNCTKLKECPKIIGNPNLPTGEYSGNMKINSLFCACQSLREIPDDFFYKMASAEYWNTKGQYGGNMTSIFSGCHSLRKAPDISMLKQGSGAYYWDALYQSLFYNCYALDEATNIPVLSDCALTSNVLDTTVADCGRVKEITFETNEDGTPKTATWSSQTLDLTRNTGFIRSRYHITTYNSGITADKEVTDDATYAALKDDPDYWTLSINYSRYNHNSAVNTINSLPDVSSGSGNVIKFQGNAGSNTDGGAIGNLTEEEIAVAAAKGWTVSLSW